MRILLRLLFSVSLTTLLAINISFGQQAMVKVLDGKTKEPVAFAHVIFQALKDNVQTHGITDEKGMVLNNAKETSRVSVSYVGYMTLHDTIKPGQSMTLYMKPRVQNMDEVVVTAQYTPQRADQSIYKIKVINSQQIARKAANNLTDLLKNDLNIRISQDGALGAVITMQGLSGENVKILVDGVPVIGRMNGNIDISQLNLYNVDHIEMVEGPMSVIYGSNALAGVINLISKENQTDQLSAHANAYYESVGIYNFDGGFSMNKGKNAFGISGGRNFFDGYTDSLDLRNLLWKPKRQVFADAYYTFKLANFNFKLASSYFDEKLLDRGDLMFPYYQYAFDTYFYTTRFSQEFSSSLKFPDKRYLNVVGAYSYYDHKKSTYFKDLTTLKETPTENPEDHDTTIFDNVMLRATYSKSSDSSKLNYQMGLDLNYEDGNGKKISGNRQAIGDYAAFLSIQYEPWKGFFTQPGVRLIYNTRYKAPLVYSLNLKYGFLNNYAVRGSFSRGFRAPSLKELYLYFVDVNHDIQGNENLKAENSYNVSFDFSYNRETNKQFTGAEFNFFYNDINNIITLVNVSGRLYSYINLEKTITKGFMFSSTYNLYPQLHLKAGYGYTGKYESLSTLDSTVIEKFYYSPEFIADIGYHWIKADVDFNLNYKYTGRLTYIYLNDEGNYVEGFINHFNTMDFTVIKSLFRNKLTLSAGLKNIFNNTNILASGSGSGPHSGGTNGYMAGWGRTFFIKASVNLNKF